MVFEGRRLAPADYLPTRSGVGRTSRCAAFARCRCRELLVPLQYVAHGKEQEVLDILGRIGLKDKAETPSNQLSQVELRKLELARAMAARPRLLISDEAMAGLSGSEVDEVLKILFDLNAAGITAIGLVVGAAGAAGLTRLLRGLLYETTPLDAGTFAGMSVLLFVVALLAAYLPARKAASVSPMEAMRTE